MSSHAPVVALVTSNGTGMGHLARQVSLALSLQGTAQPVLFSLSAALPAITYHGLAGEYCPGRDRGWMPFVRWQEYLRRRLRAFVRETGARVVVFDGVVPYLGLLRARLDLPEVAFVWMRRGFWRPDAPARPLRSAALFDLLLEPGDLAGAGDRGVTSRSSTALRIPPVSLAEHVERLPREAAAAELGLDPDRPTALVTLSSGAVNDIATPATAAIDALRSQADWQVAVTRSAVSRASVPVPEGCVELRGVYPLTRYLHAFDAAVAAGGYNVVHELLYAAVPTVFVPNRSSGTDDQPARTWWLAQRGLALYADESDTSDIRARVHQLQLPWIRRRLRTACAVLAEPSGSAAAARQIASLLQRPRLAGPSVLDAAGVRARLAVMRALGARGTNLARRIAGRAAGRSPGASGPSRPLPVRLTGAPAGARAASAQAPSGPAPGELLLTESLDPAVFDSARVVEHLLPRSSASYRDTRLALARRFFAVHT